MIFLLSQKVIATRAHFEGKSGSLYVQARLSSTTASARQSAGLRLAVQYRAASVILTRLCRLGYPRNSSKTKSGMHLGLSGRSLGFIVVEAVVVEVVVI